MVIYDKESKELIIPSGLGNFNGYEDGYAAGYADGYADAEKNNDIVA